MADSISTKLVSEILSDFILMSNTEDENNKLNINKIINRSRNNDFNSIEVKESKNDHILLEEKEEVNNADKEFKISQHIEFNSIE
jgi:hypothetical protein